MGALLAAAVQVGLGQGALDLAVVHAGERQQFGRPIGSFQALKHLLADAHAGLEVARSAVWSAAVTLDEEGPDADRAVAAARVVAGAASVASGKTCVQVHGGMGYTWELDAHLYLKRALVLDVGPGSVDAAVDAVAATL
jgi:alkylation response protein AidB-like acyl-CoA dehydrogenase